MRSGGQRATPRRRARCVVGLATLLLCSGVLCAGMALAEDNRLQIDLAPGSLQQALDRLAELTRLQILYDPGLAQGRSTAGLSGAMTPAEALEELLAPTDIAFKFTADDAVALYRKPHTNAVAPADHPESVTPARTITITTGRSQDGGYESTANDAIKVDDSTLIVPVTEQSLTQQVLRDRQVGRLEDVMEYVSGTELVPDGQSALGFGIRGLPTYRRTASWCRSTISA